MSKRLVAYFSATGTTGRVAERIAEVTAGALFEIEPEVPYTAADLNWQDQSSRSTLEMKDGTSRPPIKEMVPDMGSYDTIFLGFPIWWYREPAIIDTFIESYDFTGKTIVPFATSGGSQLGEAEGNIQELAPGAAVMGGRRFSAMVTDEELREWAEAVE